jgi:imidazolonepropionase-like amidohydrolase
MLAVANGKILTMEGRTYPKGTVLIDQGKIVAGIKCTVGHIWHSRYQ